MNTYDIVIIGGGINGAGIARDAAGQGLKVLLCEQDDLASGTSSYSSKLIHGGLRYLEHYDFRLVRHALLEREKLLKIAPHLIEPLEFIMPYHKDMRPAWLIRLGLFIYDHLAKRVSLPSAKKIKLPKNDINPLKQNFKTAFTYYDCTTDDARLVIANAKSAATLGAKILTRHKCTEAKSLGEHWQVNIKNQTTQKKTTIKAKVLINAAGPWLNIVNKSIQQARHPAKVQLVKGSHIITRKLYEGKHAYILQNDDKRVIFVIPFEENFTLVGTTDVKHETAPATVKISKEEIGYLCNAVNRYFSTPISDTDIVHSFSGLRALSYEEANNPSEITRDYELQWYDHSDGCAPFLNIIGGKLTTYRKLSEQALNIILKHFQADRKYWTQKTPLQGAFADNLSLEQYSEKLKNKFPWLDDEIIRRFSSSYGTDCEKFLKTCHSMSDLGENFGHGLYEKEVMYLIEHEWAYSVEDILWRRTKLDLVFSETEKTKLTKFMSQKNRKSFF